MDRGEVITNNTYRVLNSFDKEMKRRSSTQEELTTTIIGQVLDVYKRQDSTSMIRIINGKNVKSVPIGSFYSTIAAYERIFYDEKLEMCIRDRYKRPQR